ncbi:GAF domain-containing protein [Mangrovimonas spongiae]|uniref:GAF domain-containing protein n=1 Tax=Mangrovimonas spongiae TaxID=2494697 RepID=A0A428K610_9FLAO|nr:GAF domain-containing protein [Mangrovimonas spongiae]RSK41894.1 GAF domain-containing protein [Mangrovimonas spongiae]
MSLNTDFESPLFLKIGFGKLLDQYERLASSENTLSSQRAKAVLKIAEKNPKLREGFTDTKLIKTFSEDINEILQDSFSDLLTQNEIKTAGLPFCDVLFRSSQRFKDIIKDAGDNFTPTITNMPNEEFYIVGCAAILKYHYHFDLNFKRPFYYKIPDKNGVIRYYKITYNADFTEIIKTDKAPDLSEDDISLLLDNFDNIDLWKEKFPPHSYIMKGFVISNMFDMTDDQSISNIKSSLIKIENPKDASFISDFEDVFRAFYKIKDINVGFSLYDEKEDSFERFFGEDIHSYIINDFEKEHCLDALCNNSYEKLLKDRKLFAISDVDLQYHRSRGKISYIKALHEQGIKSAIFAPIANENGLMGILELVSYTPRALNSINANKLNEVMPYIVAAVERSKNAHEHLVDAVIQQECTSIHPSVHWRFRKAAIDFINNNIYQNKNTTFEKIAFRNVYPLFGQIDIKGSSNARNQATQQDLKKQLKETVSLLKKAYKFNSMPVYEQVLFQTEEYLELLNNNFKVDSEHQIGQFLKHDVYPLLGLLLENDTSLSNAIYNYKSKIDTDLKVFYHHRKQFDDTVKVINRSMSRLLDKRQKDAQQMYPHFFERFKTDGVEHNMYIGESITREDSFSDIYLYNLRLWQMQVMCEMENEFYNKKEDFLVPLNVASLILVFNQPMSIRFRMDEKKFDVDGTYNARYEVVKKRVDKAFVKNTNQRITEPGKLSIVYSQKEDEEEYLRYVKFLQHKNMLDKNVQIVELEDLQGVTGLKAIKVGILYKNTLKNTSKNGSKAYYNYDDLMQVIKA